MRLQLISRCGHWTSVSRRSYSSTRTAEPLRILFCGSDNFSITSLEALYKEYKQNQDSVASIDVVCRPAKRVGRGLKQLRSVPICEAARALSLPVHEIDTFTGWKPPTPSNETINLVVAVSFGKLVPRRILNGAKYGGLNLHPSMLPDFHGAAPLHHTLISGCARTGVTLQTMHPEHFDQGLVIDQTPWPGITHGCETPSELASFLAPIGAEMLVQTIQNQTFISPAKFRQLGEQDARPAPRAAPKITPGDSHIDWHTWSADEIMRKQRIIGPLWNLLELPDSGTRRALWVSGFSDPNIEMSHPKGALGATRVTNIDPSEQSFDLKTCDDRNLRVKTVKLDGEPEKNALSTLRRLARSKDRTNNISDIKFK